MEQNAVRDKEPRWYIPGWMRELVGRGGNRCNPCRKLFAASTGIATSIATSTTIAVSRRDTMPNIAAISAAIGAWPWILIETATLYP